MSSTFLPLMTTRCVVIHLYFFFNDTATTEIYTLSLHDALPIRPTAPGPPSMREPGRAQVVAVGDRKSTRLNSSHGSSSYAGFCLKKKNSEYAHFTIGGIEFDMDDVFSVAVRG